MPRKYMHQEVCDKLEPLGFELLSTYVGSKYKSKIKCHCGNIFETFVKSIFCKHTKSCGCLKRPAIQKVRQIDKSGMRFGKLVVMHRDPLAKYHWICKCDCGGEKSCYSGALTCKTVQSCGCLRKHGYGNITGSYWSQIRNGAKARNIKLLVTPKDAWELFLQQDKRCALTGLSIEITESHRTASLDRIDSDNDYVTGNIQWVHMIINKMKNNLDQSVFIKYCQLIANHHDSQ